LASLLAGLGALGFLTVGRFSVGLGEFAPVAHVWTVWSLGAATVGFGAQIETIDLRSHGGAAFSSRHIRLTAWGVGLAGLATYLWRRELFGSDELFWPIICAVIPLGSFITGLARGSLAAAEDTRRLGVVIAGENTVRFGFALTLLWAGGTSPKVLALILLAGFSVAIVGWSTSTRRSREVEHDGSPLSSGSAGAIAGLIAHASLVLPASVLALRGESPEVVAGVFLVLTYLRAPYQLLLGMTPVLTARSFGGHSAQGWSAWLYERRRLGVASILAMLAAAAFGYLASALISDLLLGGADVILAVDYSILCALVVAVAFAIARTLFVLPQAGAGLVVRSWGVAAAVAIVFAIVPGTPTLLFAGLLAAMLFCLVQVILA
jgi:hypothetical protein